MVALDDPDRIRLNPVVNEYRIIKKQSMVLSLLTFHDLDSNLPVKKKRRNEIQLVTVK